MFKLILCFIIGAVALGFFIWSLFSSRKRRRKEKEDNYPASQKLRPKTTEEHLANIHRIQEDMRNGYQWPHGTGGGEWQPNKSPMQRYFAPPESSEPSIPLQDALDSDDVWRRRLSMDDSDSSRQSDDSSVEFGGGSFGGGGGGSDYSSDNDSGSSYSDSGSSDSGGGSNDD